MNVIKKLLYKLQWFLFWLIRPKFLNGVFVAAFRESGGLIEVAIIKKRLGIERGYQLPGGGLDGNKDLEEQARIELWEETGLQTNRSFHHIGARHIIEQRNVQHLFLTVITDKTMPKPVDTFEIAEALFIDINKVGDYLQGEQLRKAKEANIRYMVYSKRDPFVNPLNEGVIS